MESDPPQNDRTTNACRVGSVASPMRRAIVLGTPAAMLLGCHRHPIPSDAVTPPLQALAPDFLRLSQTLTGKADLDPITAGRIAQGFQEIAPETLSKFSYLGTLLHSSLSASQALEEATGAGLKAEALAIVAAWYTGTVGKGTQARTVSYRDALMQRPVADTLPPPTYVLGGPAWWTALPPDLVNPPKSYGWRLAATAERLAPESR